LWQEQTIHSQIRQDNPQNSPKTDRKTCLKTESLEQVLELLVDLNEPKIKKVKKNMTPTEK